MYAYSVRKIIKNTHKYRAVFNQTSLPRYIVLLFKNFLHEILQEFLGVSCRRWLDNDGFAQLI
jgi:hypothetical protein